MKTPQVPHGVIYNGEEITTPLGLPRNAEISFDDLEDDFDSIDVRESTGPYAKREQHPCSKCNGKGVYQYGYANPRQGKCFACNGKGYFLTSAADRAKAKASRDKSKASKQQANADAGLTQLLEALGAEGLQWLTNATWSDFYQDLLGKAKKYGSLSEKQLACVVNGYAKQQARDAAKNASAPTFDLVKINELFATALSNGIAKPKLVFGELKLSLAPANGKNGGCLYVKDSGEYAGKITPEGQFFAVRGSRETIPAELQAIAEDPKNAAIKHGQATGNCACCNRLLTNAKSIEIGIGPICLENWGL